MIDAIIFDFDGIILDTETSDVLAWQQVYGRFNQEFPLPLWQQNIGSSNVFDPFEHLAKLTGLDLNRADIMDEYRRIDHAIIDKLPIMPGVQDRIAEAKQLGLKLAVASSSPARWLNHHLPRLGLLFEFEVVRTCTDVDDKKKPDPAVYLSACAGLKVDPSKALAFEDSMHGTHAAKAAGMHCVAVPNEATKTMDFSAANLVINSLATVTLTEMFERLGN